MQQRYLVVTGAGFVSVFCLQTRGKPSTSLSLSENHSPFWKTTEPDGHLKLESDAMIVELTEISPREVLALSEEGHIYRLSLTTEAGGPLLVCKDYWNTGMFGSTCITTILDPEKDLLYALIGYDTGLIEARSSRFTLLWRGLLQAPIRSLAHLRQSQVKEGLYSVVVSLQVTDTGMDIHGTTSMVDVLNLNFQNIQQVFNASPNKKSVPLYQYLQMPTSGMEFVDSSTLTVTTESNLPKRVQFLPSRGTDASISLEGGKKCGVTLSDGTLAILSSNTEAGISPSWGISKDLHQLLLSYPAIGCGSIRNSEDGEEYFVCCLRAGTCFLIRNLEDKEDENEIVVIPYLHDVDGDLTNIYIQAFTAGEVLVANADEKGSNSVPSSSTLPIFVYALAGGIIDVYASNLIYPTIPKTQEKSLQETLLTKELLEDAEILSSVARIMKQMDNEEENELWQNPQWRNVHKEFNTLSPSTEALTLDQLNSPAFSSFKRALFSLLS
jgi:hypothetical protein